MREGKEGKREEQFLESDTWAEESDIWIHDKQWKPRPPEGGREGRTEEGKKGRRREKGKEDWRKVGKKRRIEECQSISIRNLQINQHFINYRFLNFKQTFLAKSSGEKYNIDNVKVLEHDHCCTKRG